MARDDKDSVGLNGEGRQLLDGIETMGWFSDRQALARFCLAYAVRRKVPEGTAPDTDTAWAAGNFDKTNELRILLSVVYPQCSTPVRLMEHLILEGLRQVAARIRSDGVGPAELLE